MAVLSFERCIRQSTRQCSQRLDPGASTRCLVYSHHIYFLCSCAIAAMHHAPACVVRRGRGGSSRWERCGVQMRAYGREMKCPASGDVAVCSSGVWCGLCGGVSGRRTGLLCGSGVVVEEASFVELWPRGGRATVKSRCAYRFDLLPLLIYMFILMDIEHCLIVGVGARRRRVCSCI